VAGTGEEINMPFRGRPYDEALADLDEFSRITSGYERKIRELITALEFYANEGNWEFPEPPPAPLEWDPEPSRVIDDDGEIARAAIAKARSS